MKKVQCENKHYYDADIYEKCPHCSEENLKVEEVIEKNDEPKKFPFIGRRSKDKNTTSKTTTATQGLFFEESNKQKPQKDITDNPGKPISETPAKPQEMRKEHKVIKRDPSDSGKTIGFFASPDVHTEPVVGWLVCIKGESMGESFEIISGRNSIGRSLSNEIALEKEMTVSREKHAVIIFDHKKCEFYLQPGEGKSMPYLNDGIVMGVEKLTAFDKIELGECSLVFIPLCGEKFKWDDYINKEK